MSKGVCLVHFRDKKKGPYTDEGIWHLAVIEADEKEDSFVDPDDERNIFANPNTHVSPVITACGKQEHWAGSGGGATYVEDFEWAFNDVGEMGGGWCPICFAGWGLAES